MLLTYIDETGNTPLSDRGQPLLTLAAAVVDEDQVQPLARSVRSIVTETLGDSYPIPELHGQQIWAGSGPWQGMEPPELLDVFTQVVALIDKHNIRIAHATINKVKLDQQYAAPDSPYLLALQFLCEKLDSNIPGLKILIADESKEVSIQVLPAAQAGWREVGGRRW